MQHAEQLRVVTFRWDDGPSGNLEHCALHKLTPTVVCEVHGRAPLLFLNDPDKTGSHVMVAPDARGRFWTVIILPTAEPGEWKPITGWPSTKSEIRRYNGEA
jgi:hypothetical protein